MDKTVPAKIRHSPGRKDSIDPRLIVLIAIAVMALLFSTASWWRLFLFVLAGSALLVRLDLTGTFWRRVFWLRWLILSIILMHMLLSPGYTLWGTTWITYEGLMRGLMVALQLILAMAVSLALVRSMSAEKAVQTFSSFLKPLSVFGLDGGGVARQLRYTLHFVPIMQQEGADAVAAAREIDSDGFFDRVGKLKFIIMTLFVKMIDRADAMAYESAAGTSRENRIDELPRIFPLNSRSRAAITLSMLAFAVYTLVP